jgi:cobalt/nickel transport system ATP-binding protein
MEPILNVENVSYAYHQRLPALSDISLEVFEGEILAVIGANGSGKSTLLQIMNGLIWPDSGRVFYRGKAVTENTLRDRAFLSLFRSRTGYIFQDADVQLFCPTVLDEMMFGPLQLNVTEEEAGQRARSVMELLEIAHLGQRACHMLSGGEKKRVSVGAILTMNPDLLLLDEPTGGLDPRSQCFFMELLIALHEAGKTLVIATHDLSFVGELKCRVVVLSEFHGIEKVGAADEILGDKELLLRVNLVHEHRHFHGDRIHSHVHTHFPFHRHGLSHDSTD